jgi:hypothetical protein
VLERLGKIDGVEGCAANYTGTMIRISAKSGADREKVAEAVQKDLAADKRNPARITGDALTKALKDEEWKGSAAAGEKAPKTSAGGKLDPTRQIVLKVEGLTCPAVKGLGCGHRLAPVLARLNKIDGVEKSFSNWPGTLLRISVAPSADRDKDAAAVREDLTKDNRKPVLLTGAELKQALEKEEWRMPGELSAIEFRTLAQQDYRQRRLLSCLDRCTHVAIAYPDSPEAAEARQLAAQIKNDPALAQQLCEQLVNQAAALYLAQAELALRANDHQRAALYLERVLQVSPGTQNAQVARRYLDRRQGSLVSQPCRPKPCGDNRHKLITIKMLCH